MFCVFLFLGFLVFSLVFVLSVYWVEWSCNRSVEVLVGCVNFSGDVMFGGGGGEGVFEVFVFWVWYLSLVWGF